MMACRIVVNNVPKDPEKYIVARLDETDMSLWYWGSWSAKKEAEEAARDVGGVCVEREDV